MLNTEFYEYIGYDKYDQVIKKRIILMVVLKRL